MKICKFTVVFSGSFCQIYRVTDEALIAETMVWPNFFLMNVFIALRGSKKIIIIYINGDPELTLTYFTARSSWVTCISEWGKLLQRHLMMENSQQRTILTE